MGHGKRHSRETRSSKVAHGRWNATRGYSTDRHIRPRVVERNPRVLHRQARMTTSDSKPPAGYSEKTEGTTRGQIGPRVHVTKHVASPESNRDRWRVEHYNLSYWTRVRVGHSGSRPCGGVRGYDRDCKVDCKGGVKDRRSEGQSPRVRTAARGRQIIPTSRPRGHV